MISIISIFENAHVCDLGCLDHVFLRSSLSSCCSKFSNSLLIFIPYSLSITKREVFKSPIMTVNLSISSVSSVHWLYFWDVIKDINSECHIFFVNWTIYLKSSSLLFLFALKSTLSDISMILSNFLKLVANLLVLTYFCPSPIFNGKYYKWWVWALPLFPLYL